MEVVVLRWRKGMKCRHQGQAGVCMCIHTHVHEYKGLGPPIPPQLGWSQEVRKAGLSLDLKASYAGPRARGLP